MEDRGEEAALIRTLTEALGQPVETPKPPPDLDPDPDPEPEPELELLLVLEEEKNQTGKIQEEEERWMKVELTEKKEEKKKEVLDGVSALRRVFEEESDQETFNGFDSD